MKVIITSLLIGYVVFVLIGSRLGNRVPDVIRMSLDGVKRAITLILILLLIGALTGSWRSAGSIVVFVYYGIQIIRPHLFLIVAFLLTCILSYALGTSFGVAGTAGVIFMTLARSGQVDPVITAGVILSGIYFGDRTSPASSTAFTVASVTGTDLYTNVRNMIKTGLVPWLICLAFYGYMSFTHPIASMDPAILSSFEDNFALSPWAFLPAAVILIFPLAKIPILITLITSICTASAVALLIQHESLPVLLRTLLIGYTAPDPQLQSILNGGGVSSMLGTVVIVAIACSYTGILDGTGMINSLQSRIERLADRIGLFPCIILITLCVAAIFCNQVVAIILCNDLLRQSYDKRGRSREEHAIDIENAAITLPAMIPWCILISVPLAILGVTYAAVPYALFIYLLPLYTLIVKAIRGKL